jgi:antitoxin component YwqK of YwqJK toxin-antitoxin module
LDDQINGKSRSINFLLLRLETKVRYSELAMDFRMILLALATFACLSSSAQELGTTHINSADEQGRKQGLWKVYDTDGGLKYKGTYVDGKPVGEFVYFYPTGKVQAEVNNLDMGRVSYIRMYHPDGKLMTEGKYLDKKKDSTWNYYNGSDGSLALVEHYKAGIKEGEWTTYYPSGQVMEVYRYTNDLKEGPWKQYFSDGSLKSEGTYKHDNMDGLYVLHHLNGNVEVSGTYKDGQKDGTWVYLNEIGELQKKEVYKKGVLISLEETTPKEGND